MLIYLYHINRYKSERLSFNKKKSIYYCSDYWIDINEKSIWFFDYRNDYRAKRRKINHDHIQSSYMLILMLFCYTVWHQASRYVVPN